MLDNIALKQKRLIMRLERYKSIRKKPKRDNTMTKSKKRMLAKPKTSTSTAVPKLREIYSEKIEWATHLIPKLKEEQMN